MLYRSRLIDALEKRRADFVSFDRALRDEVGEAAAALRALAVEPAERVRARASAAAARVSYPSGELDRAGSVAVAFGERWRSHEEARRWAVARLAGRVTFAADGSQIFPGRETSVPVAAVQVASFENPHTPEGRYTKDVHFEVITPDELTGGERAYESPDQIVGLRRFELEARAIGEFVRKHEGWRGRGERAPVAFLDGTLLISSRRKETEVLFFKHYAAALARLVRLSREAEVPVVGYVDHSYAPDLRDLLEALGRSRPESKLYDAQILRADDGRAPLLHQWGDRTVFFHCQRANLAESFFDESGAPLVGFVYLQTTSDGNPARLEIPAWVYEAGLLEEVADAVRAECVVGNGYPYAIETADEAAVMTARDRAQFLRTMQDFAEQHRFDFRISRKAASKGRRR
ncbi:MAG TPA: DNA double-strand break repair nuclease NurA [Pyrinomonadaceae bacterium]|nr:DNA double-strand break repair nuclease NurA [Pyrinomonadaceae bacterium]